MLFRDFLYLFGKEPEEESWYQYAIYEYAEKDPHFYMTIEDDEMIWYDFSYVTGKEGGKETFKKYEKVLFKRQQ